MYFSLEKLLNYPGNRYALARAAMEYAKKVRILQTDEYVKSGEKDAVVAIDAVLNGDVKYKLNEPGERFTDEMDTLMNMERELLDKEQSS